MKVYLTLSSALATAMPSHDHVFCQNVIILCVMYDLYKTLRKVPVWLQCALCFCFHCQWLLVKSKYRHKDPPFHGNTEEEHSWNGTDVTVIRNISNTKLTPYAHGTAIRSNLHLHQPVVLVVVVVTVHT